MKIVFIIAVLIFLKVSVLYRIYHLLPLRELKRRARGHDAAAAAIYKVAVNTKSLDLLLYLFGFAAAALMVIAAAGYAWWWAFIIMLFIVWLSNWAPQPQTGGWLWRFSVATSPYTFRILSWLNPALNFLAGLLPAKTPASHTGAYEKEDLLELLARQADQADNRISKQELQIAAGGLSFGDKLVAKIMTPRRAVRFVSEDEVLGPLLLDELHKSGLSRFPVAKGPAKANMPVIVGTLYLKDIIEIGQEDKGKVKDHMKAGAHFINESCDLRQALSGILSGRSHLLIVVNNFEEMVGVITLEDILEQIIGRPIVDEFDKYDDLRAVAGLEARRERAKHSEIKSAVPAEMSPSTEAALVSDQK